MRGGDRRHWEGWRGGGGRRAHDLQLCCPGLRCVPCSSPRSAHSSCCAAQSRESMLRTARSACARACAALEARALHTSTAHAASGRGAYLLLSLRIRALTLAWAGRRCCRRSRESCARGWPRSAALPGAAARGGRPHPSRQAAQAGPHARRRLQPGALQDTRAPVRCADSLAAAVRRGEGVGVAGRAGLDA